MAARQREIRPPAKAKACDVCANAALFVYRHFTGAACTTSSDGRFALFGVPSTPAFLLASGLSNSSDMVRSRHLGAAPCQLVACSARPIQNVSPGTTVAIVGVHLAHGTPQGGAWNRMRSCALQSRRL